MSDTVIIAPHSDDEIIGCFSILNNPDIRPVIIYTEEMDKERQVEVRGIREHFTIKGQMFCQSIPPQFMNTNTTFYFPGPDEIHPAHRTQAAIGEALARQGLNVIFYSTNMNVPFIEEETFPDKKKEMLDKIYPSQSDLWKYDHKYFLFRGYMKWLF
jgi:hypothetical protein